MLRQDQIAIVIDAQREVFLEKRAEQKRDALKEVPVVNSYATIITGIRRCGKSTLLLQLLKEKYKDALYFNFEDIRLVGFEVSDFTRLLNEFNRRGIQVLFLDEIQLIPKWEIFVNQLLREGFSVFITGSNASLLSTELGTHLTGRQLSMELFPFSYKEFISFRGVKEGVESLKDYLDSGGIPEFVKSGTEALLGNLMNDIVVRDIAVRHGVRDVDSLRQLAVYLMSNVGSLVSANKLAGTFGIKSSVTILEYFSHFKDAYLLEFLPRFSYSIKSQSRNPKKVYAVDTGFVSAVSTAYSDNTGHRLENLVFLHLRRFYQELYYFREKKECDFVAFRKGKAQAIVQVCSLMEDTNFDREYSGLLEALNFFQLNEGVIVTYDQCDVFQRDGKIIKVVPAHQYLLEAPV